MTTNAPIFDVPTLQKLGAQPFGTGGGTAVFLNRYDLSVNGARVELAAAAVPVMLTGTMHAAAGAYNGGGVGNKSILAFKGHAGVALGSLGPIVWSWTQIDDGPPFFPYANLVVDIGGGVFKIFPIDPLQATILNVGTLTSTGPGSYTFTHDPAVNFVQVVNAFPPGPNPISPPVPVAAGAGPVWNNAAFRYSDIVAAFPASVLVDAASGDGGLPAATITPALLLGVGDSS